MTQATQVAARVKELALRRGVAACGVASPAPAAEYARFAACVEAYPAPLGYLVRGLRQRKNIKEWYPAAASMLLCAFPYWDEAKERRRALSPAADLERYLRDTGRRVSQPGLLKAPGAKLSRYVLGADYHAFVTEKLDLLLRDIQAEFPGTAGRSFCDTSPVMEKDLGRQAGLGFRGRNTLLISPELGSWFFLGGLALSLPLEPDAPAEMDCGDCRLCEAACPTGALAGGKLTPEKCLSYWTTQAKEPAPAHIAEAARAAGCAYGCDICQEVCPYNSGENKGGV